jgi:hypothetical protein
MLKKAKKSKQKKNIITNSQISFKDERERQENDSSSNLASMKTIHVPLLMF